MPYIKKENRPPYDPGIDSLIEKLSKADPDAKKGEMNYVISRILKGVYGHKDNTRYTNINDAIGVLECVKLELYRRVAAPYEDVKIEENGDV